MTNDQFIVLLKKQLKVHRRTYTMWRKGQLAFNVLYFLRPTLANRVRATEFDPFYDDTRVASLMKWVHENYNEGTDDDYDDTADDS